MWNEQPEDVMMSTGTQFLKKIKQIHGGHLYQCLLVMTGGTSKFRGTKPLNPKQRENN